VLVWGGDLMKEGGQLVATAGGVPYDPVTNRWSAIPQAPTPGRAGTTAVWTGTSMIVVGGGLPGADTAAADTT
jgi:hypothetical protein